MKNYRTVINRAIAASYDRPVIFCLLGNPGAGKSTAAIYLAEMCGIPQFKSYTTRPKRLRFESEYHFLTEDEAKKILDTEEILARTVYGGNIYFGLVEDVKPVQSYVIDPAGAEYLLKKHGNKYKIITVWIEGNNEVSVERSNRMFGAGDINYNYIIHNTNLDELCIQLLKLTVNTII